MRQKAPGQLYRARMLGTKQKGFCNMDYDQLLRAGIAAPSGDNCQPWKFTVINNAIELRLDYDNMGLFFDVNEVATQISCGAVIENIAIAARLMGMNTLVERPSLSIVGDTQSGVFAKLTFEKADDLSSRDLSIGMEDIFARHSDRRLYKLGKKIPSPLIDNLSSVVQLSSNYQLTSYDDIARKKSFLSLVTRTDIIRFTHKQLHEDFHKVLRFGRDAFISKDGLADKTLGLEFFLLPILKLLKPWRLARLLNAIGLSHVMAFRGTWLPMTCSSSLVSITHTGAADYVESGRVMQRFWLQANKLGLSVQTLGALPLFLARYRLAHGEGFLPGQIKLLATVEDTFTSITPDFNKETDQLVMLFRLGYANDPACRSYRRDIGAFES